MKIKPTKETMDILNEIADLKNMEMTQAAEKVLEIYSSNYLNMITDAKKAAKNATDHYDR